MARSLAISHYPKDDNMLRSSMYAHPELIQMNVLQKAAESHFHGKAHSAFKAPPNSECKAEEREEEELKEKTLTFHFAGIRPLLSHKARLELDDIEFDSIVTVKSSLTANDSIKKLKRFIHSTFDVPLIYDMLILYAHVVISRDDRAKLSEYHLTDRSLLTLAISNKTCLMSKVKTALLSGNQHESVPHNVYKPSMHKFEVQCVKGFDPITLDSDAATFKMPLCQHQMAKKSLYQYVESQLSDKNTRCLTCPHSKPHHEVKEPMKAIKEEKKCESDEEEDDDWRCGVCNYPNSDGEIQCDLCSAYKPWNCDRCTFLNVGVSTDCHVCHAMNPLVVGHELHAKDPLCRKFWSYPLVKQVLMSQSGERLIDEESAENGKQRRSLLNDYYSARYKYSTMKHAMLKIPFSFEAEIMKIETKLMFDHNVSEKRELTAIRNKAMADAPNGTFSYPKPEKYKHRVSAMTAKLELLSARNTLQNDYDLQKCPKCCTIYYQSQGEEDGAEEAKGQQESQKVGCPLCKEWDSSFCWDCGKEWGDSHLCDMAFRNQLIDILATAETKTIGSVPNVPAIRSCPNCSQLITHVTACKHMKCAGCKLDFCFVCLKAKLNGAWQCGSSSAVCPIAPRQNDDTLPNNDTILKRSFQLF